ncbi:MAG: hypothetical protein SFX18_02440 [Pirellulales bacterium]|nr:hypothetical protein [Pirellulales bacterium]
MFVCVRIFSLVVIFVFIQVAYGQEKPLEESAGKIAASLRERGLTRIGVLPIVLEQEINPWQETNTITAKSSQLGELYCQNMQESLLNQSQGDFEVVDLADLAVALKSARIDIKSLTGTSQEITALAKHVEGGLEAIVIGTFRDRPLEPGSGFQTRDIIWKTISIKNKSVLSQVSREDPYSLAAEVYQGRSQEFFRWDKNVLRPIGFGKHFKGPSSTALKPSDPLVLYGLYADKASPVQDFAILNPNCPYKVQFEVDRQIQKLMVGVMPQSIEMATNIRDESSSNESPVSIIAKGNPLDSTSIYLPINPGEGLKIRIRNDSPKRVMVAIFVDGINILGKRRELPDEYCQVWALEKGVTGTFSGWYSGPSGTEQVEPFVIKRYEDSVAGKLGETERVGTITLVFFNEGYPQRQQIKPYGDNNIYEQVASYDEQSGKVRFFEGYPIYVQKSAAYEIAMGGKKPQPSPLKQVKVQPSGTILVAMTIPYATKDEIVRVEDRRKNSLKLSGFSRIQFPENVDANGKIVEPPPPTWVEVPTSWK